MPPSSAHADYELIGWLLNIIHGHRGEGIAPGGDFLRNLAQAALRADFENYPILRPALIELRAKYPEYLPAEQR